MYKLLIGLGLVVVVAAVVIVVYIPIGPTPDTGTAGSVRIGFSLGTLREERWQKDIDLFTQRAKKLGASVITEYANDNAQLQITQAESLIAQGVDVLVVVAQDGALAADIVTKAHAANIPVIAYDRLIAHPKLDLFVTFDSRVVGELEAREIVRRVPKGTYAYIGGSTTDNNAFLHKEGAMRVLKPLITKGDIKLAVDSFSPGWRPDEAYKTMKTYLQTGGRVDAVVAANDGTAGGVIQALAEKDLAGTVPVAGQDADLGACRRLVSGTQSATVYKSIKTLAYQAAEDAVALGRGDMIATGATISNGTAQTQARLLTPVLVTRETLDATVIADGYQSRKAVYSEK
jgi:D-xylose transport system substrate-binding protein